MPNTLSLKLKDVQSVFEPMGKPSTTYVERNNGKYEAQLRFALSTSGSICIVAGPSKTGKTTLYSEVCQTEDLVPIVVRCDETASPEQLWLQALQAAGATYTSKHTEGSGHDARAKVQAGIDVKVPLIGSAKSTGELARGRESSVSTEAVPYQGPPGPWTVAQVCRNSNFVIVFEDAHFLREEVRRTLYQQSKTLTDNKISQIIVCTSHSASDPTYLVKDLTGRCMLTTLPSWDEIDLEAIALKGFRHLGMPVTPEVLQFVARESVGLPFLTQVVCRQMVMNRLVRPRKDRDRRERRIEHAPESGRSRGNDADALLDVQPIGEQDAARAMHQVACHEEHRVAYERYLRNDAQSDYDTWAALLSAFAYNPLSFALTSSELTARMRNFSGERIFRTERMAQILAQLQSNKRFALLQWEGDTLYMTEPIFLFYLRWHQIKQRPTRFESMAEQIYEELRNGAKQ